jgi:hypothetical protein
MKYLIQLKIVWICCLAFPSVIWAQKIENKTFNVEYVRLPYFQLTDDIKTYSARFYPNKYLIELFKKTDQTEYMQNLFLSNMILDGYEKIQENGNISLVVSIQSTKPFKAVLKSERLVYTYVETQGDKKITKEIPYTAYYYVIDYGDVTVNFQMKTLKGAFVERTIHVNDDIRQFGSKSYETSHKTATSVTNAWKKEELNFLKNLSHALFTNIPREISEILGDYCLRKCYHKLEIEYPEISDKIDTESYEAFNQGINLFFEGLGMLKNDSIVATNKLIQPKYDESKTKIKEAIKIWEDLLAKADSKDKTVKIDKGVVRALYFNLTKAYTWIQDFPKAMEYLQLRRDNKGGVIGIGDKSVVIDRFEKFLHSQELRYTENSWRVMYKNTLPETLAKEQKKRNSFKRH